MENENNVKVSRVYTFVQLCFTLLFSFHLYGCIRGI